jgi:hypothetical protein
MNILTNDDDDDGKKKPPAVVAGRQIFSRDYKIIVQEKFQMILYFVASKREKHHRRVFSLVNNSLVH